MTMKTFQARIRFSRQAIVWCALATAVIRPVAGQSTSNQQPPLMDRQKEIALALSACPPSVASKAAVYVLDRAGYVKVRDGENGFTAIVQHAVPTSQDPQCMDAEGSRTFLPRDFESGRMARTRKKRRRDQAPRCGCVCKRHFPGAGQAGHRLYALHREPYTQRERRGRTFSASRYVLCAVPNKCRARIGRRVRPRRQS